MFLICLASSKVIPFSSSVAYAELAITEPQPKALKTASSIFPSFPNFTYIFNKSPQATEPTVEVPTFGSFLSRDPTFGGFSKYSTTF